MSTELVHIHIFGSYLRFTIRTWNFHFYSSSVAIALILILILISLDILTKQQEETHEIFLWDISQNSQFKKQQQINK